MCMLNRCRGDLRDRDRSGGLDTGRPTCSTSDVIEQVLRLVSKTKRLFKVVSGICMREMGSLTRNLNV